MMRAHADEPLDLKRFQMMYLTISALPTILPLLTFVLWVLLESPDAEFAAGTYSAPALLVAAFGVIAALSLPAALFARASAMRPRKEVDMYRSRAGAAQGFGEDVVAVMRITSASIAGMAIPEISLLLGFVLAMLTAEWGLYFPFAAYTALAWVIMFPRPRQLKEWYSRQTGQESSIII